MLFLEIKLSLAREEEIDHPLSFNNFVAGIE
jgi:hypothetical protein